MVVEADDEDDDEDLSMFFVRWGELRGDSNALVNNQILSKLHNLLYLNMIIFISVLPPA